jgi:hypothetical protein
MTRKSVDTEITNLTKRQKAIKAEIGSKTVTLEGKPYTGTALADMCGRWIAADQEVEEANRAWRKAVANRDLLREQDGPVFNALKGYVQATYGKSSQTVAAFGYKPAEAPVKSAETKAAAVVKLRATRSARHTMGSKQRQSIKGAAPSSPTLVPSARAAS